MCLESNRLGTIVRHESRKRKPTDKRNYKPRIFISDLSRDKSYKRMQKKKDLKRRDGVFDHREAICFSLFLFALERRVTNSDDKYLTPSYQSILYSIYRKPGLSLAYAFSRLPSQDHYETGNWRKYSDASTIFLRTYNITWFVRNILKFC